MGRRRYGGYHGRTTARDALKLIIVLLVLLLLLAAAVLMFGQRYIIYTDDGVRLELPFFQREEGASDVPSISTQVVQLPRPEPETSAEGTLPETEK